jgi:hypothetical protein
MSRETSTPPDDDLRPEYDETSLRGGVRGKYAARYAAGTNLVRLDADVAASFPSERAVNDALRLVMRLAEDTRRLTQATP